MNITRLLATVAMIFAGLGARAAILFDKTTPYHHIQVVDDSGVRTLSFNGSWETKMNVANPLSGHFEYTEYFQMPFVWNRDVKNVLMVGLGGGSTTRAYNHYYTNVVVDTVEIDQEVVNVAMRYFGVRTGPNHIIHTNDARIYLNRATNKWDAIFMDAYSTTRFGSSLPKHLVTKEFFVIANNHLSTNGVFCYNVIGQIQGFRQNVVGAIYKTMKEVFPQVYMFPAEESQNIVIIGTKSREKYDKVRFIRDGKERIDSKVVTLGTFATRLNSFWETPPPNAMRSPTLTDDYAPIEALLNGQN